MRSQLAERLGVVEPQILHLPPDVHSLAAAEEAIELADAYGLAGGHPLDDSQKFTLRAGLGEREDGTWAASTVADFEARQNGKNDTCGARELAGLVLFGEKLIIHTAHEFSTANESFLRLVATFEAWDDLRKLVARIRYANGEQGIELLSGQRLKYKARTGGGGRGFAEADLVVYDEAQHLKREHLAASAPTKLANPNSQSWFMGSGGLETSEAAWRLRTRAIKGDAGRLAYVEHTAENVTIVDGTIVSVHPDPLDREAWAQANPAYGRRITDESLLSLYDELGPELFARECLCLWDPERGSENEVLPIIEWELCRQPTAERGDVTYAIEVDGDQSAASIAASDGSFGLILEWSKGSKWLPAKLAQILEGKPGDVWLDPQGPAGALLNDLRDAGIEWHEISARQYAQACGELYAAVVEDQSFHHEGQPVLDIARRQATRKTRGDAWVWDRRRPDASVSPLGAVTIARWAALQQAEDDGTIYDERGLVTL